MNGTWTPDPCEDDAGWTEVLPPLTPWPPGPCEDDAGWTGVTICRRPYGVAAYGMGPYGRCAIIGGDLWGSSMVCAPFTQQAPAAPSPWGRRRG
jgi:hypothetical protein